LLRLIMKRPPGIHSASIARLWCVFVVLCQQVESEPRSDDPFPTDAAEMRQWFLSRTEGPGVHKWMPYFDVYAKYLARFRGTDVHFAELGIWSGGSLAMWRWFLGPRAVIYGVDISNRTVTYQNNSEYGSPVKILIGDQGSPGFWDEFKKQVPRLDVFLDDGSHMPVPQKTTVDAVLPHLSPGGVYLTEDLHGGGHLFVQTVFGSFVDGNEGINNLQRYAHRHNKRSTYLQRHIASISFHVFMIVIEIRKEPLPYSWTERAPKRGTKWQPPAFWHEQSESIQQEKQLGHGINPG